MALAGALAVILAACSGGTSPIPSAGTTAVASSGPSIAPASADNSPTASGGIAGSLAGKRIGVVFCCQAAILDQQQAWVQNAAKLTGRGETLTFLNASGDAQKALEIADSFVAQGFDAIMSVPLTFDGWDGVAERAKAKGMVLTNHSASPVSGADLNVLYPHERAGFLNGENAGQWLQAAGISGCEVGMGVFPDDPGLKSRSVGFAAGIKSVVPDVQVWEANAGSDVASGASVGANLIQAHPNICVMFGWNEEIAVGMVQAAAEASKTDPATFYIGTPDATPVGFQKILDGTPMQAVVTPGFPFSSTQWLFMTEEAMLGQSIKPTALINVHLVTKDTVQAELAAQSDPLAANSKQLLDDALVLFDQPLKFGDPVPDIK
jgi:ABC-type sugar transport system substrate-binding protein